ncbi:MAG: coiled-coil domain-containing protein [Clostridium sp.]|uniref:coiled-coil domain-containing protein n=1 Tax=Clostridium sp. TaxID=1506 RepID=UPI003F391F63
MKDKIIKFLRNHKITIIIAIFFACAINYSDTEYKDKYNDLTNEVTTLSNKTEALKTNDDIKVTTDEVEKLKEENNKLVKDEEEKNKQLEEKNKQIEEKKKAELAKAEAEKKERENKLASASTSKDTNSISSTSKNTKGSSDNLDSLKNSSGNSTPKPVGGTVYWTPNGKSYHKSGNCTTLKRSKVINSGTLAESGKSDPCNVCCK